ncbi:MULTISPECIES: mercuric transporter MerT family protein [Ramlibacter]|uniref:Mercuric transport protein MerT n=1 Tax=Ramlibacter aquaticus TaxID=2780094 RepID=A0ABR9SDY2_9BURK|nr:MULTISPECIES: mercuric transporter MerT family protein [Ramlibacter]MBE7940099.1 mercury transporter MerT [Ramlibacter aquaticus]
MDESKPTDTRPWSTGASLLAGAAAAVGASACCAGPLVLVLLGIGGGLGSRLVALERYQPYFIAATLAFLGFAFYRLYVRPAHCAPVDACAVQATRKRQKAIFWVVSVFAVGLMASPLYAPLFY